MKKINIFLLFIIILSNVSFADLTFDIDFEEAAKKLPKAKDPVSSEIMKMELQENYEYERNIAAFMKGKGIDIRWWSTTKTETYINILGQFTMNAIVLFADENYAIEVLSFYENSGITEIQSKKQLEKSLSPEIRNIINDWNVNKTEFFSGVNKVILESKFCGIKIKEERDGEVFTFLKNKEPGFKALFKGYGLPGNTFLVIHDLNKNKLIPRRLDFTEGKYTFWESKGTKNNIVKRNEETKKMYKIIENAVSSIDRTILPGRKIYERGSSWNVKAKNMKVYLNVFYPETTVKNESGKIEFKNTEKMSTFYKKDVFRIIVTGNEGDKILQYKLKDKKKEIDVKLKLNDLEAFIEPIDNYSYLSFLIAKGTLDFKEQKKRKFWNNQYFTAKPEIEILYYCQRNRVKVRKKENIKQAKILAKCFWDEIMLPDWPFSN